MWRTGYMIILFIVLVYLLCYNIYKCYSILCNILYNIYMCVCVCVCVCVCIYIYIYIYNVCMYIPNFCIIFHF